MASECNCENIEVNPTIELTAQVDMGSTASEYNAEAWAVGQRGGVDVPETDQTYHNNAKYYAGLTAADRASTEGASQATAQNVAEAQRAEQAARGAVGDAETAAAAAAASAQEAADTVIAAQGPGICYIGDDGIPFILE